MSNTTGKKQGDESDGLMSLFQPPSAENDNITLTPPTTAEDTNDDEEKQIQQANETAGKVSDKPQSVPLSSVGSRSAPSPTKASDLMDLFTPPAQPSTRPSVDESTPLMHDESSRTIITGNRLSSTVRDSSYGQEYNMNVDTGSPNRQQEPPQDEKKGDSKLHKFMKALVAQLLMPTTYIGAFMFLLYHIVFSLTMGAAITRPHGGTPMLGVMSKMSASGVMFASIVYWWALSDDVPALYPAVDLFCAPFLANLAAIVDETLFHDSNISSNDNDVMFLATFTFLTCLGLAITATLLMLASVFKLANLGAFLPSPVLSGFFAAVGVLLWTLAVKVDTGGMSIGQVLFSGSWNTVWFAVVHHVPSLVAAGTMKYLSPKSPFYVVACIVGMIGLVYAYMGLAGLELQDMVERGWFWSKDDLVNTTVDKSSLGFAAWAPPAPTGWIHSWIQGYVHWGAVNAGLSTAVALSFLYMIRTSLHGAALKKNISLMERLVPVKKDPNKNGANVKHAVNMTPPPAAHRKVSIDRSPKLALEKVPAPVAFGRTRQVSEAVEIDPFLSLSTRGEATKKETKWIAIQSKPTKHTLTEILEEYAYSQYICALVGGFAMTPSIGPSSTLYSLGAEALAPQVGSVILLSIFFLTEFQLVVYIPKPAFSSVLCLAAIDIMDGWFIKSYQKTQNKIEWLVNPFIVIAAFSVGLLSAVFLGLALSTFFFVASFYQSGVVKYAANGIMMRSTIERPPNMAQWLDQSGDYIQILVLQSYLFFGNATSVLKFLSWILLLIFADRGLFFIEEGTLRIERSTDATSSMTRTRSSSAFISTDSIGHLRARSGTVARQIAQLKYQRTCGMQSFRVARIGPGWVIGDNEALSGLESPGAVIAVDQCRLHYISFNKLQEIEKDNPLLILNLYKLMSRLNALRSEVYVGQFATLHSIMSAPSHNKPLMTRGTLARQHS